MAVLLSQISMQLASIILELGTVLDLLLAAIIAFNPCDHDKKCHSEHRTSFRFLGGDFGKGLPVPKPPKCLHLNSCVTNYLVLLTSGEASAHCGEASARAVVY